MVKTALFGLMSVFGMRKNDSHADAGTDDVANALLNGSPALDVNAFFLRAEKRIPFAPSTVLNVNIVD